MFRSKKKPSSSALRTPGQTALLHAVRLTGNKEIGPVVENASLDDLEWFVQILEYQLIETPNWVKDEKHLHEIQAWHRRVRTMAAEILHNKRVAERRRDRIFKSAWEVSLVVGGAIVGFALGKLF